MSRNALSVDERLRTSPALWWPRSARREMGRAGDRRRGRAADRGCPCRPRPPPHSIVGAPHGEASIARPINSSTRRSTRDTARRSLTRWVGRDIALYRMLLVTVGGCQGPRPRGHPSSGQIRVDVVTGSSTLGAGARTGRGACPPRGPSLCCARMNSVQRRGPPNPSRKGQGRCPGPGTRDWPAPSSKGWSANVVTCRGLIEARYAACGGQAGAAC